MQAESLTFLRLFFVTADVIEVNMMRGHLQAAWNHRHDGDELTLLRQDQLFFLALLLPLHPDSAGQGEIARSTSCVYMGGTEQRRLTCPPNS